MRRYVHAVVWQDETESHPALYTAYTSLWTLHSMLPHYCMSITTYFYRTFLTTVILARPKYELPDDGHRPKHVFSMNFNVNFSAFQD
jgi:hypothetical protein